MCYKKESRKNIYIFRYVQKLQNYLSINLKYSTTANQRYSKIQKKNYLNLFLIGTHLKDTIGFKDFYIFFCIITYLYK